MPFASFAARTALWCLVLPAVAGVARAAEPGTQWHFTVLLDGRPIGTHDFDLAPAADGLRALVSDARFEVKILGFTAYHYRHHADERWRDNCLASITANTDDDGHKVTVSGATSGAGFTVTARSGAKSGSQSAAGCVMSFAYWNPQLATQSHLLDPGTGRIEAVTITALPPDKIEVHGEVVAVSGVRISGLLHPIDVWYIGTQWVGLDTSVRGGRKLSYRLP